MANKKRGSFILAEVDPLNLWKEKITYYNSIIIIIIIVIAIIIIIIIIMIIILSVHFFGASKENLSNCQAFFFNITLFRPGLFFLFEPYLRQY